jgi:hypothetical protein
MIFTDNRYVFSDNPENDYQELRDFYIKYYKNRFPLTFQRYDGVMYHFAKKSIRKELARNKNVFIVGKREFMRRLRGEQTGIDGFIYNVRPLQTGSIIKGTLSKILLADKLKGQQSFITQYCRTSKIWAVRRDILEGTDAYLEVSQRYKLGRCWLEKDGQIVKEYEIPKNIVDKIEEKTRYLPKK